MENSTGNVYKKSTSTIKHDKTKEKPWKMLRQKGKAAEVEMTTRGNKAESIGEKKEDSKDIEKE